jgi:hypothetical protein
VWCGRERRERGREGGREANTHKLRYNNKALNSTFISKTQNQYLIETTFKSKKSFLNRNIVSKRGRVNVCFTLFLVTSNKSFRMWDVGWGFSSNTFASKLQVLEGIALVLSEL